MEPISTAEEDGATPARTSPITTIIVGWLVTVVLAAVVASVLILNGHGDIGQWVLPVVAVTAGLTVRYLLGRYTARLGVGRYRRRFGTDGVVVAARADSAIVSRTSAANPQRGAAIRPQRSTHGSACSCSPCHSHASREDLRSSTRSTRGGLPGVSASRGSR